MSDTKSTKDKIKEAFKSGKILTSCGAAQDFLTSDLRKYISTLRGEGMDISDKVVTSTTGKKYKEYFLREFTPKQVAPDTPVAPPSAPPSVPSEIKDIDPPTCTCPPDVPMALLHAAYPPEKQQQTLFE